MKSLSRRGMAIVAVILAATAVAPSYSRLHKAQEMRRGRLASMGGKPELAVLQLEKLREACPDEGEVAYLHAVALRRSGALLKAKAELNRAEQLGWTRKDLLRERWMIDFQSGQITLAGPHLHQMLNQGCSDELAAEIYECLVKGYLSNVRLREAEMCLKYWLEWRPNSVPARILMADILDAAKDRKGLMRECAEILKIDANQHDIRLRLAFLLLENNDVSAAHEDFQRCVRSRPDDDVAKVGLAACRRQLGDPTAAKAALEDVLTRNALDENQKAFVLSELGQVALAEKSYELAREYFEEALRRSPANATVRYSLGLTLARLGDKQAAEANLEQSRKLETKATRLAEVTEEILRSPDDVALRCEAGELCLDLGNRREAFMWLLSALRMEKWHAPTHLALARYYSDEGDKQMTNRHLAWAAQPERGSTVDESVVH